MRLRRDWLTLVCVSALLVILSLQRPARDPAARPRNLLVITLDTIRADRLPPYGFAGVETRLLDRLAAEGTVFSGPVRPMLDQAVHPLSHPDLGELEVFLVPVGADGDGVQYEAVFG